MVWTYNDLPLSCSSASKVSGIVTEQSADSSEPEPKPNDAPAHEPAINPGDSTAAASVQQTDEGLPEWEPLTPELVEDEAIRGDFVIRWVVVGLALLLGISQISETRTLIHLKSGLQLINNGFLPAGRDPFSYTANDRRWVNLPWLFDITTASIHSLGGGTGLSIFQGLIASVAFAFLAHTVRPNIRTWWGSICAVLALLTCYSQITVQPELITLLGVSVVLWILVRSEEIRDAGKLWSLVPIIWLWAQFDQRAWFGWFLLILWTVGERLSRESLLENYGRLLVPVTAASFVVAGLHPFLWESWLSPLRMYLTDYPAMQFAYVRPTPVDQVFFPIWSKFIWSPVSHRTIAALVLMAATLVTLILNRSQLRFSHLLAFAGFNLMGLFATHELASASLVNCVISTLNAQTWYREKFGQVYSIDWRELLFSRGGRAVTVLSFFTLAWLILSGRLDGPGGKRTGLGIDIHLANAMRDYESLNSGLIDDHPFNFSVRQGDLMIWGGQKTFVDSRVGLFFGSGEKNLLELHSKTRTALQLKRESVAGSGEPGFWKPVFDKYQIHQAWPRLNGPIPAPDYTTFADLLSGGDFMITSLNSSTAIFIRTDQKDEATAAYLKDHVFDSIQAAFRTDVSADDQTREWAKPATTYDNLFSLRRPSMPGGIQAAKHYLHLATWGGELANSQRIAFGLLAIRKANEGLREDPHCDEGYRILGLVYSILGQLETGILSQNGSTAQNSVRYFQSIAALQQALALQPDDALTIRQLMQHYEHRHRVDIQLELAMKLKRLTTYSTSMSEEQRQERTRLLDLISRLEETVSRIDNMVAENLDDNKDRFQVAAAAFQAGGLLRAIRTLEEDAIYLAKNPQVKLVLGNWMMEAGRNREAAEIFESLEGVMGDGTYPAWRDSTAISGLATANYRRSIKLWSDQAQSSLDQTLAPVMYSLPLLRLNPAYPLWLDPQTFPAYPAANIGATAQFIQSSQFDCLATYYQILLAQMEFGSVTSASQTVRKALELNPGTTLRPVLRFYLECLTGEQIPAKIEEPEAEVFTDLLAPPESKDAPPENKKDDPPK